MSRRLERINHLIRDEISDLLQHHVRDPRLNCFLTVTRVSTTTDLTYAKVYISVMGDEGEKKEALEALAKASGFLRRELSPRLTIRHIPELRFYHDDSIEQGARILELIKQVSDTEDNEKD